MNNNTCKHCGKEFIKKKNGAKVKYCSDKCYKDYRREYNRIKMREVNPPKHSVNKVCEHCGNNYEALPRGAHSSRFCSDNCKYTWWSRQKGHRPLDEWESIREEQKRKRQAKLEKERAIRSLRTALTKVIKLKEEEKRIKELTRGCVECGETFYDPNPVPLICSKKCMRKRNNRIRKLYNSKRFNKVNIVDKDITLEKLYKRDSGLCYLCGTECEYDDKVVTKEGHFIVGRYYPSIDHVKPLSKGGMHSWDNVKLAHHYCNTIKNDNDNRIEVKQQINRIKHKEMGLVL